ncbi:hypothetical protein FKM82_026602 [Ascaphus truei]
MNFKIQSSVPKDTNFALTMEAILRKTCSSIFWQLRADVIMTYGLNRTSINCAAFMESISRLEDGMF